RFYLNRHANRLFRGAGRTPPDPPHPPVSAADPRPEHSEVKRAAALLSRAKRPVLVVGSQALLRTSAAPALAAALSSLGAPVYLAGGARGRLGPGHPLQMRHKRREALRQADLVLLAGIPNDFRLDYGRQIGRGARLLAVNRSAADL